MSTLLKRGSNGAAVRDLQTFLNAAGTSPRLKVDADFGAATERAVKAFQKKVGLVVDGKAGPQTVTALKRATEKPKAAKAEPDKSAMKGGTLASIAPKTVAAPPPNVGGLVLRDTARPIDEIIVHCAATPEGKDFTVADIRAWHKARGWSDIGYHYVVYRDGRILEGRPVGQVGAHCADKGKNKGTIGICYVGGVAADGKVAKDTRTAAQRASLLWLVAELAEKFSVKRITGHNQYAAKACPSFSVPGDALGNVGDFLLGDRIVSRPTPVLDAHPEPKKAAFVGPLVGGIVVGALEKKITGALERLVKDEDSPVTRGAVPEIVKTVAEAALPQVIDEVLPRIEEKVRPITENANNQEPWYQSRVILGTLVSVGALGAGLLGAQVDAEAQGEIVDAIIGAVEAVSTLVAIGGSLYALYGRIRGAKLKPLGK
jgi:N-acetylmuramoyl-L-alanine amidase